MHLNQRPSVLVLTMALVLALVGVLQPSSVNASVMTNGWHEPVPLNDPAASWMATSCAGSIGYRPNLYHTGRDYWADIGTSVVAIGNGTIVQNGDFGSGFARALFIKHVAADGTEFTVLYGHINTLLIAGATVVAGSQVGTIAQLTGVESHLHLGLYPGTDYPSGGWGTQQCANWPNTNGFVDPVPYLNAHPAPGGTSSSGTRPILSTTIPWAFETFDGDGAAVGGHGGDMGRTPATVHFGGRQYVFYYDTAGRLWYAFTNPAWLFNILDGAGGPNGRVSHAVGQTPAVIAFNTTLHLFYYDTAQGNLRHGWSSNPADYHTWLFETLDGDAQATSGYSANLGQSPLAVEYGGTVHLFYYDASTGNLRHAWADSSWHFENLDGDPGSVGHYNSDLGLDPAGVVWNNVLHLFYYDAGQGNLRHAWANSNGWFFENLEGDQGSVSGYNADVGKNPAAVVYTTTLQVFYYAQTGGNLRHAWANANGWSFENLDGDPAAILGYDGDVGATPAAAVIGGTLQVFAYEPGWGALRHYWADTSGWHGETLDGLGGNPAGRTNHSVGLDPAIGYNGTLQLFYYDGAEGNVRHAFPNV